ncbi:hypothetical protein LZC95_08045 [Pendulispora brunnea]|uniref:Uncharacterized protein n=1 Tax=Pendulispora brunnea TaxID=2905690 RepID=A0ABZ2KK91_9BACT
MKLSALSNARLGAKAERPITIPIALGDDGVIDTPCVVVPLTAAQDAEVLTFALEYARARGAEPKEGEPLFDLACMVKTIELSVRDVDSPREAREPFFDGGTDQVLQFLSRETIVFVYERQQIWQDECSPSVRRVSAADLVDHITRIAEAEDDLPFVVLSPAMRWICTRIMARLHLASAEDRLPSLSPIERIGIELKTLQEKQR